MDSAKSQEKETARLEAFSDGVFAVAITLLVLNLRVPTSSAVSLLEELLSQWPSFLAFVTSFVTILIMWMNHHNLFNYVKRTDRRFMFLNGLLLLLVTATPFTTSLVAEHILLNDAGTAAAVYSGTYVLTAIVWNVLWRYASSGRRLLDRNVTDTQVRGVTRQYYVGPITYMIAFLVAFLSGVASVLVCVLVAAFYAVTATVSN